jgi:hypothetical protein
MTRKGAAVGFHYALFRHVLTIAMNFRRSRNEFATTSACNLTSHKATQEKWPIDARNVLDAYRTY